MRSQAAPKSWLVVSEPGVEPPSRDPGQRRERQRVPGGCAEEGQARPALPLGQDSAQGSF